MSRALDGGIKIFMPNETKKPVKQEEFERLFYPKTVAIIGASNSPLKLGYGFMEGLVEGGFAGEIYPVNPKLSEILGLKVYPSLSTIPISIDMAIVTVPGHLVPSVLRECAQRGVKGVILLAGGFKELNTESGIKLQEEIVTIANRAGIKIIGPNTLGLVSPYANLNASFVPTFKDVKKGNIAVICQSGGVCSFLVHSMINKKLGVSLAMSLGNRGNVEFADLVEYLAEHSQTRVIALYIEGVDDPLRLIQVAKRVVNKKPIVAYKVGGEVLSRATLSHTGSLAGKYEVYSAAFSQAGIIPANDCEELIDVAKALSLQPPSRGNRVAVLSPQAGPGIIAAYACQSCGLTLAGFSPQARKRLKKLVGPMFFCDNPVDITMVGFEPQKTQDILDVVWNEGCVDVILISCCYSQTHSVPIIEMVLKFFKDRGNKGATKPVVICHESPNGAADREIARLEENSIPVYPLPERAARAAAGLVKYGSVVR